MRARLRRTIAMVALGALVLVVAAGCAASEAPNSGGANRAPSNGGANRAPNGSARAVGRDRGSSSSTTASKPLPPPTHTACSSVVYIGDSTSDGESNPAYVPNRRLRAPAQLERVGVKHVHMEVSGARSIVETFQGFPNGATVARGYTAHGYHGCWIVALGTNDAADVNAGSNVGLKARIERMMSIIGDQPVMWVNVLTIRGAPEYYEESGMRRWDENLVAACRRYRSMRVMNWAALAKHKWFIPDGVHYTTVGYEHRTKLIARALVNAFPRRRPASSRCEVR